MTVMAVPPTGEVEVTVVATGKVEQLVIAIKQGWISLHSEHPRARSAGPDGLLNQIITLCIDEYYEHAENS